MKSSRRKFLQNLSLGSGMLATLGFPLSTAEAHVEKLARTGEPEEQLSVYPPTFNMSGYQAPKIDKVRIGIIGIGMRGSGAVKRMTYIENVQITGLCDLFMERVEKGQKMVEKSGQPKAAAYDGKEGWKALCDRKDIDLIYICTPWELHTPMAVYAMQQGKHVAVEVPAATTLDECWQLVETSEKTKKHCMMLENCCYDFFELLTLNMARNGMFGEIVHGEGAYIHCLLDLNFNKNGYVDMWRLKENAKRNGNLYPTHGLGPICQTLNINRGDQMDYLVSMSGFDFTMNQRAKEMAAKDSFFAPYVDKPYRGNMNSTLIHTVKGKTMLIQHDVSTPRPYSRIHLVSGTKGIAQKWPDPERISFYDTPDENWINDTEMAALKEKYTTPLVKHVGEMAKKVGGHGGMDFMMDWRLIDCLRNGIALDQDVYDAALWSAVAPLSEASVAKRSKSIDIPDFTKGAWKTNKPVDLTLGVGGNTTVRKID